MEQSGEWDWDMDVRVLFCLQHKNCNFNIGGLFEKYSE